MARIVAALLGTTIAAGGTFAAAATPAGAETAVLGPGQHLACGQKLNSANALFTFQFLCTGQLVEYDKGLQLRYGGGVRTGAANLYMQTDGNLVMRDAANHAVWASNTAGHPGAYLQVQDDGNVVLRNAGSPGWSTHSSANCDAPKICLYQAPGANTSPARYINFDSTMPELNFPTAKFHDGTPVDNRVSSIINGSNNTVCFYTEPHEAGAKVCLAPHTTVLALPALVDNVFSSYRVEAPVSVRDLIEIRAMSWVNAQVPYSQTTTYTNGFGTYREDCSGFVSMAWNLPGPGPSTAGIARRTRISWAATRSC